MKMPLSTRERYIRTENGLKFKAWLDKHYSEITSTEYYWSMGKFFGYPDCCIKFFVVMVVERHIPVGHYMEQIYGEDENYHYVRCHECRIKDPN
jgi:hypothetical protein